MLGIVHVQARLPLTEVVELGVRTRTATDQAAAGTRAGPEVQLVDWRVRVPSKRELLYPFASRRTMN